MPTLRFQAWLDERSRTFIEGDFETNLRLIALPWAVATRTNVFVIDTPEKLREGFDAWVRMLKCQAATDLICTARTVTEIGGGMLVGQYETRILRDAVPVVPPYMSSSSLREVDGTWRSVAMTSGMANKYWPISLPKVLDDGSELNWTGNGPEGEEDA